MLFCGQCGLRLNPGDKQCPRCGTPIEPGAHIEDEGQPDAPTVASPSLLGHMQAQPPASPDTPGYPQQLILRPEQDAGSSNYGTQAAYEATRRMGTPEQNYGTSTPGASSYPGMGSSYPGYPQSGSNYPSQDIYTGYPQSGGNYAPQGTSYPGFAQQAPGMGYQPFPNQQARTAAKARGRTIALLIILFGLLLILVAMMLLILERNGVLG